MDENYKKYMSNILDSVCKNFDRPFTKQEADFLEIFLKNSNQFYSDYASKNESLPTLMKNSIQDQNGYGLLGEALKSRLDDVFNGKNIDAEEKILGKHMEMLNGMELKMNNIEMIDINKSLPTIMDLDEFSVREISNKSQEISSLYTIINGSIQEYEEIIVNNIENNEKEINEKESQILQAISILENTNNSLKEDIINKVKLKEEQKIKEIKESMNSIDITDIEESITEINENEVFEELAKKLVEIKILRKNIDHLIEKYPDNIKNVDILSEENEIKDKAKLILQKKEELEKKYDGLKQEVGDLIGEQNKQIDEFNRNYKKLSKIVTESLGNTADQKDKYIEEMGLLKEEINSFKKQSLDKFEKYNTEGELKIIDINKELDEKITILEGKYENLQKNNNLAQLESFKQREKDIDILGTNKLLGKIKNIEVTKTIPMAKITELHDNVKSIIEKYENVKSIIEKYENAVNNKSEGMEAVNKELQEQMDTLEEKYLEVREQILEEIVKPKILEKHLNNVNSLTEGVDETQLTKTMESLKNIDDKEGIINDISQITLMKTQINLLKDEYHKEIQKYKENDQLDKAEEFVNKLENVNKKLEEQKILLAQKDFDVRNRITEIIDKQFDNESDNEIKILQEKFKINQDNSELKVGSPPEPKVSSPTTIPFTVNYDVGSVTHTQISMSDIKATSRNLIGSERDQKLDSQKFQENLLQDL